MPTSFEEASLEELSDENLVHFYRNELMQLASHPLKYPNLRNLLKRRGILVRVRRGKGEEGGTRHVLTEKGKRLLEEEMK